MKIVAAHPETQFTIVFPPVDMFYWDGVIRRGELDRVLEAERSIFEALAPYENVRVFSFFDDAEIATNFDLYSDTVHFLPEINTEIFEMTVAGEYQLHRGKCGCAHCSAAGDDRGIRLHSPVRFKSKVNSKSASPNENIQQNLHKFYYK